ncbi:threonine-phosphate decarboxylase [bacterium BMS3Bbin06]|nr:threonine-phosphate decarboxylase [bacterium BMS3Bbin06]
MKYLKTAHGGNIYRFSEETGIPLREVIDFSASINPLGSPCSVLDEIKDKSAFLHNYPDPEARELRRGISEYYGIAPEQIVCGNGCTELIYMTVRSLKPERILIPAPSFSEYERASNTLSGTAVKRYTANEERGYRIDVGSFIHSMEDCDLSFLCNPNNPTGKVIPRERMIDIIEAAEALRCYLVVDESFMDFCPDQTVMDLVSEYAYLIVLRSMTKFYALPGLRIGYGLFPVGLLPAVLKNKEPWTVNSLAIAAGVAALKDEDYRRETLRVVKEEKNYMEMKFKQTGIGYFESDVNYYLVKMERSVEIMQYMARKGILLRNCLNFLPLNESFLRIAVKKREDNERFFTELISYERNRCCRDT